MRKLGVARPSEMYVEFRHHNRVDSPGQNPRLHIEPHKSVAKPSATGLGGIKDFFPDGRYSENRPVLQMY